MNNTEFIKIFTETATKKPFSLSQNTIESYLTQINLFLNYCNKNIVDVTKKDIKSWLLSLREISDTTYNVKLSAIRTLYKILAYHPMTEDLITVDPTFGLIGIRQVKQEEREPLSKDEQTGLLHNCKNIREKAIITLMIRTGIRVNELINIKLSDYLNMQDDKIELKVNKGSKQNEYIYMTDELKEVINQYLKVRKNGCNKLFVSNRGTEMNSEVMSRTLKVIAKRSGQFDGAKINNLCNHALRHTSATNMLNSGVPIEVCADILHHSGLSTIKRYAVNNENRLREAMEVAI